MPDAATTESPSALTPPLPKPRRWLRRLSIATLSLFLLALVTGELIARFYLQLGDPPLFQPEQDMRYRMVPSSTYHRLGNTITYNRVSMRATPDIDEKKATGERRILVIGDSVTNGGAAIGDRDLATTLLQDRLRSASRGPVVVMNASAGSWSPIQELAYLRRFGLFNADTVVMVFNHEDALDDGAPRALSADQPTRKPLLALEEVVLRFLPSAWNYYVMGGRSAAQAAAKPDAAPPKIQDSAIQSTRQMVLLARAQGAKVAAVLHYSQGELTTGPNPGLIALRQGLRELDVPTIETAEPFRQATQRALFPYRDPIHPSRTGQGPLLESLQSAVASAR